MSRIGKQPITIADGVTVTSEGATVIIQGPKGNLRIPLDSALNIRVEGTIITMLPQNDSPSLSALTGTTRTLLSNAIMGVTKGWEKKLELSGVGYRASVSGRDLVLSVGFSHPVKIPSPDGIQYQVAESIITVLGSDKQVVGEVAAKIRRVRPPEPYKGKGIHYLGEKIRRKAGKAAKAAGAAAAK